jgi:AcrR family transcriptional regulator
MYLTPMAKSTVHRPYRFLPSSARARSTATVPAAAAAPAKRGRRPASASTASAAAGAAHADPRTSLLDAAEQGLRQHGYAGLSTRKVAEAAGVPLSQIHYHFGSKEALMLALLERQNQRLLDRQQAMFAADVPLWQRWERACDFLDDDLASGYVRVLQEMVALGWSNAEVAAAVRAALRGWYALLASVVREASATLGGLGGYTPEEIAALVGNLFMGGEAMLLLGFEGDGIPVRATLRRIGPLIRVLEERRSAAPAAGRPRKR